MDMLHMTVIVALYQQFALILLDRQKTRVYKKKEKTRGTTSVLSYLKFEFLSISNGTNGIPRKNEDRIVDRSLFE
jgi:hypothetical protein